MLYLIRHDSIRNIPTLLLSQSLNFLRSFYSIPNTRSVSMEKWTPKLIHHHSQRRTAGYKMRHSFCIVTMTVEFLPFITISPFRNMLDIAFLGRNNIHQDFQKLSACVSEAKGRQLNGCGCSDRFTYTLKSPLPPQSLTLTVTLNVCSPDPLSIIAVASEIIV